MNAIARWMIGRDTDIERRNVSWNMLGSLLYALASMLLTIVVVQLSGEDEGGIFAFAFSTFGQHMFMAAYFGMRPFHITDMRGRFTYGEYRRLRLITCGCTLVFAAGYLLAQGYTPHKTVIVGLMVLYKVIDALADVYESEFQRAGRLYLTGKSNTFRTLLSMTVFIGALALSRSLLCACLSGVAAQAAGVIIFDLPVIRQLQGIRREIHPGRTFRLFRINIVLFVSAVLDFYVFSAARYAIDQHMADRWQAVFTAVFMPTNVINLVAGFVIRPYVTAMSRAWMQGERGRLVQIICRLWLIIAALTVVALGAAWWLGIPVLSLLYPHLGYLLRDCRGTLMLVVLGGACNACINLFYYALIVMDAKQAIFGGYCLAAVLALLISAPAVERWGLWGGGLSYLTLMTVLAGFLMLMTALALMKNRGAKSEGGIEADD